ncbi:APC family permease [Marinicella sp. S1101]|uniref:APC family permease n=1 Tax=Marinicella marina TaxID=2996016 RepID=UPI00226097AA|nr:APC family permease [Marinicella marina]MCX7554890.1 APC family permease [Marinicella marina]MDJ1141286.1 APC family permease [Marinicella marina]
MSESEKLPRTVGFWGAALLPVNGMIGSGIFALPAIMVAAVGNFAPWMMLVGALIMLPLVLVFAALSTRYDSHGGPVLYAHEAFGSFAGFQSGWMRYASGVVAIAANTHVAVAYLAALFPVLENPTLRSLTVVGFIIFTTGINLIGMRGSVRTLGVMTVIKLTPLLFFIVLGLFTYDPMVGFSLPQFSQFESVVLLTFYAFMAFENGTFAAGELRNPQRNIPLALITTLAAVALFYMLVIWTYLAINPTVTGDTSALAAAANELAGQAGVIIISLAAAFSIGANTLSGGIVIPRMTFGMAERGDLPKIFAHVSKKFKTPDASILFYGGFAVIFSLWAGFATLAVASTLSRLVMYLLSALALPVLNHKNNATASTWHLPVAAIAALSTIWVASQASAEAFKMLGIIFVVGTALYFMAVRSHSNSNLK